MADIRKRIELWFGSVARTLYHHPIVTLLVMIVWMGMLFSQLPKITLDTSTEGFLHKDDQTLLGYNTFRDEFGRDEMLLIAIKPPDVFDLRFLEKLKALHEELEENVPYLDEITSLINARNTRGEGDELLVEDLLEEWPESEAELAALRQRVLDNPLFVNLLISEDAAFTTIAVKTQSESATGNGYLTDAENSAVVESVHKIVAKYDGTDFQTWVAGSPAVTHSIKQALLRDIRRFMALAILLIAVVLFVMFRKLSGVLLPLGIVIMTLLSTLSLMAAVGIPMKLPTQILPSFLLAVGVGAAVHILAMFFHHLRQSGDKEESIVFAAGHSGLAVVMTSLTTAGGLISFATSSVSPIADLGVFGSIGVMLSLVYTIVLLPPLLALSPIKITKIKAEAQDETLMDNVMKWIGTFAIRNARQILAVTAVLMVIAFLGATKIHFSHDVLKWFPKDDPNRQASEMIDKELKGSVTFEVLIDVGKENGLYEPELMDRLDKSIHYFKTLSNAPAFVGKAVGLPTMLKEINKALHENQPEFYTIPQDRELIAQEFLLFEMSGSDDLTDVVDSLFSKTRITLKLPFTDAMAYKPIVEAVETHLQDTYPDAKVTMTGMIEILVKTIFHAMTSMAESYGIAFVVITILMILLIGRLNIGLLSMVPNLFPILLTLGIVGWFNIPMTLFTMLVGSIAIGLAVDDTIHFMHNFRRYHDESNEDTEQAIMKTLHTSGRAMLVASIVLSLGFFIFMFASMNSLFDFGLLTGITILTALLADYFISPALLVEYQKWVEKRRG